MDVCRPDQGHNQPVIHFEYVTNSRGRASLKMLGEQNTSHDLLTIDITAKDRVKFVLRSNHTSDDGDFNSINFAKSSP